MAWEEVYYEHYLENMHGVYWEEEKVLPYIVVFRHSVGDVMANMENFSDFLISEGFMRTNWGDMTTAVLVNMRFRKFAMMNKPANHSSVDNRNYTEAEFINEIFEPWKALQE